MKHKIPEKIDGIEVEPINEPLLVKGENWQTMVRKNENEKYRMWEFSLTTGRIVETTPESD